MEIEFDDKNPWHTNVHLVFGFQCVSCETTLGVEDIDGVDLDNDFLGFCVNISKIAQESGWQFVTDFSFKCPKCSK